ncbi:putative RNA methyltransferase [Sinomonas terrae]|uniref:Methyltransferase domain-containing protein n=1 Tax=Sinomonas terrae TaxID=2908838 RepID=A0ABS9U0Z6_9MICC|nr:methyltransferase domain-containing protein [Sinomonas terrae]MCH6470369.1 methyltransferase domain-containing protein [Sinomonas terrae]
MPLAAQELLRCPVCAGAWRPAAATDRSLVCTSGHRFDAARQGYVNFLTGRGTRFRPDTADMVAARERFLASGHYAPIAEALADSAAPALMDDAERPGAALDAGAGTGYYLAALLARVPGSRAVALDLSRHALGRAAKLPGTAAVVWDLWRPLPLPDGVMDAILDVFAPRNFPEFARVLRRGGLACVVTPEADHLAALRDVLPMLDVPAGKADDVERAAGAHFDRVGVRDVRFGLELDAQAAVDLALMGPAGHHVTRADLLTRLRDEPLRAEGAVQVTVLRRV